MGGGTVDIRDHRGKVVLVSFVYSQCPDTCPLIMQMLRQARDDLGAAADDVEIVLVSTDPEGDTPANVRTFLARYDMADDAQYLIGSRRQLEAVWRRWGVATEVHAHQHDGTGLQEHDHAGLVDHTSLTYGVSADGRLTTAYPVNFPVAAIVHDVPLLASS